MANDKAFKVKNTLELAGYNTSKAVTAVDVFVYDTSKDSDGGAWRKRTQHTSWYNETLNTATRGARREFPAVAVIVAESNKVTIYDGDDPSLPMWMVFEASTDVDMLYGAFLASLTSIVMRNAVLVTGANPYALNIISFLADTGRYINNSVSGSYFYKGTISERNDNKNVIQDGFYGPIVNGTVNDVAMTVLPDAPIDPATGLPVPTIAVATEGGVSVIKDDGTVVDIVHTDNAFVYNIWLRDDLLIYNASQFLHARPIPDADVNAGVRYVRNSADVWFAPRFVSPIYTGPSFHLHPTGAGATEVLQSGNNVHIANTDRLNRAIVSDEYNGLSALYNFTTSTYNTGWMNGDIKLATLSDTDATNVTGSELVTNGTFDSDLSGWSVIGDTVTYNNGTAEFTNTGTYGAGIQQLFTGLEVGSRYILTLHVTGVSGNYGWYIDNFLGSYVQGVTTATGTTFRYEVEATSTSGYLTIKKFNAGTITIDNISVRLAEEDRSVNGNGLQVFGTVNKTPVATGADLVAYSGFSNSNYLMQPYNSDLDFTTEFCYNVWAYKPSDRSENSIISRGQNLSTNGFFYLGTNNSGQIYGYIGPAQINTSVTAASGVWNMYTVARSSGTVSFYLNGKQVYSVSNPNSLSNTVAKLYVGTSSYGVNIPYSGSIALARASATAPSPEQIKKIYEDEKVLFQEGAQATLYGSSDAVTALAYDDSTNLLHVGTSAGRSVFQGLRRVDNTTTAVGAAISASNGLVADE